MTDITQMELWFDSQRDAIHSTIQAMGGFKVVGSMLWPSRPVDQAGRDLSDCLRENTRRKLDVEELAMIRREARKQDIHTLAAWEMKDAGYAPPQPVKPEDEQAALMREFNERVASLVEIQNRLVRAGVRGAA